MSDISTMSSSATSTRTLTGFFDDKASADRVVEALVDMGIPRDDITMVAGTGTQTTTTTTTVRNDEHIGFWESLGNMFLPDEDRYSYAEGLRRGGYMVTVHTIEGASTKVMDIFEEHGSVDLDEREASWKTEGWTGYVPGSMDDSIAGSRSKEKGWTDVAGIESASGAVTARTEVVPPIAPVGSYSDDTRAAFAKTETSSAATSRTASFAKTGSDSEVIPVVEETLKVGKREVGHGRVRVRSYVVETPVSEQVSLRQERVNVERHAVDRALTGTEDVFRERTIELDEKAEEAIISKEARVTEEIRLNKEVENRSETISDTVRRTEVEIDDARSTIDKSSMTTDKFATTTKTSFEKDRR